MMHGDEKSDLAHSSCEAGERGGLGRRGVGGAKGGGQGNASEPHTPRTQHRDSVSQAPARVRTRCAATHPRWEPYALIGPVRICAGGVR